MSHGFIINDASGNPIFNSDSLGWRWHDSFEVGATETDSIEYTELPADAVIVAHGVTTLFTAGGGHDITVSGRTVSWVHRHGLSIAVNPTSPTTINVYVR